MAVQAAQVARLDEQLSGGDAPGGRAARRSVLTPAVKLGLYTVMAAAGVAVRALL